MFGEKTDTPGGRFQSTLPVGGATLRQIKPLAKFSISIHAPRGGSDHQAFKQWIDKGISIHAPRGGSDLVL